MKKVVEAGLSARYEDAEELVKRGEEALPFNRAKSSDAVRSLAGLLREQLPPMDNNSRPTPGVELNIQVTKIG